MATRAYLSTPVPVRLCASLSTHRAVCPVLYLCCVQINLAGNSSVSSVPKLHAQILRDVWRAAEPKLQLN